MLKTKIPKFESYLDGERKELIIKRTEIDVTIDTSIFSQQRWEANFPEQAEKETLFAYVERLQSNKKMDIANAISQLKALYCFLESDEISTFKSFLQMFDLSNEGCFNELTNTIKEVFEIVLSSSSSTSKNY